MAIPFLYQAVFYGSYLYFAGVSCKIISYEAGKYSDFVRRYSLQLNMELKE